jgi:hypothetical protein
MKSRLGLGISNIGASEFHSSRGERLRKIGLFVVACVLLAVFFFYLTAQVQIGTAHATDPDAQSETTSQ